jgi:hypothetical protein
MGIADKIEFAGKSDSDLKRIGGQAEKWLIGELFQLPRQSEDQCPELAWDPEDPPRHRWDVGLYAAVFYIHLDPAGVRIAVIEHVLESAEVTRFVNEQLAAAKE